MCVCVCKSVPMCADDFYKRLFSMFVLTVIKLLLLIVNGLDFSHAIGNMCEGVKMQS